MVIDLPQAKFAINLLAVIEEKTKGNLSDEESGELTQALSEFRNRFPPDRRRREAQAAAGATAAAQVIDPSAKS